MIIFRKFIINWKTASTITFVLHLVLFLSVLSFASETESTLTQKNEKMSQLRVTFIGHATVLIEIDGKYFLTDPVFSDRIGMLVKRKSPVGMALSDLPPLTAILISHAHYDHYDISTLKKLDADVPIIVPRHIKGLARSIKERDFQELDYWKVWEKDDVKITSVPAHHHGGRLMIDSFYRSCNGYVIERNGIAVYFAGDTARFNPFEEIGSRFDLDLALLPIGAYSPALIMLWSHLRPLDAMNAFKALDADYMIPMHWGTFKLSLEPLDEPVKLLDKLATEDGIRDRVVILQHGQSWCPSSNENDEIDRFVQQPLDK